MAKYTENLIPIMTNNTAPNGIASANEEFTGSLNYQAWRAFNSIQRSIESLSAWAIKSSSGWLTYEFLEACVICKYILYTHNDISAIPKSWTFEGSNDNTNWKILDTQTNQTNWQNNVKKEFVFHNTTAYKKYRINISANNTSAYTQISGMEMMGSNEKYLLKQNDKFYTIKPDQYKNNQFQSLQITTPAIDDYKAYGFDDLNLPFQNMTVGSETFRPVDKFDKSKPLEVYKCVEK